MTPYFRIVLLACTAVAVALVLAACTVPPTKPAASTAAAGTGAALLETLTDEDPEIAAMAAGYVLGVFSLSRAGGMHCAPAGTPMPQVVALAGSYLAQSAEAREQRAVIALTQLFAAAWSCGVPA